MRLVKDYDYELPKDLIAQDPVEPRDHSKLMVLDGNKISHRIFYEIEEYFEDGDVLVLNDTKVIPARLNCLKSTGGRVELLVMNLTGANVGRTSGMDLTAHHDKPVQPEELLLECLVKGRVREGTDLEVDGMPVKARIVEHIEEGRFLVNFKPVYTSSRAGITPGESFRDEFVKLIDRHGTMPLPPYIKTTQPEPSRYQTFYSSSSGSIAAPTAGLHFTPEIFRKLEKKGVTFCFLTLHISYGTFKPVKVQRVEDHQMDYEYYQVSADTAEILNEARNERRLTAVGTTSVRTLETLFVSEERIKASEGITDLFIYPGYTFRAGIDRLITNFHFPRSTLLMLISAFAGYGRIKKAYEDAKERRYRFYSFGDAMFIL